jgi:hypothetical protein
MKRISFLEHVLPHIVAIAIFLIVTVFFFKPAFLDDRVLQQSDILQFEGSSKSIVDYREKTGEEPLWTNAMFGGMPAYLISTQWGNQAISYLKSVMAFGVPHPFVNIYLAFLCYYIMLLAFKVRPYLAIGGAIAFGLSSYMIIGIAAGHNARIGAIAFTPLIMAGIHLAFSGKRLLGFGLTAAAIALHLRENHIQITYYFSIIVGIYGIVRLVEFIKEKRAAEFLKTSGLLLAAALLAAGTFFGQFWAIGEYAKYSKRGKSDLQYPATHEDAGNNGLPKEYTFRYSNGILEPFTLLIPNFYGGSTFYSFVQDKNSETFKAMQGMVNNGNEQLVNQLYNYTRAYWGPQFDTAPYYGGAIIVFLFAVGIAFADKKYTWWLVSAGVIGIMLSWGSSFSSFNYFLYDYLPGYNKFRSVTFTLFLILFAMPLLGLMGLEKLWEEGLTKTAKRKLLIAFGVTGGLCLLFWLFAGMFSFTKPAEDQLPAWLVDALKADRKNIFKADAFRSLAFITGTFILIYFDVHKKISPVGFYAFLIFMITVDLAVVDKRYFSDDAFKRKRDNSYFAANNADQAILQDQSYYRVYNLQFEEARTSYYHNSIGGYHGAKMKRYEELYDSCISKQTQAMITNLQQGKSDFSAFSSLNMLNAKYIVYGPERANVIFNRSAYGPAWFVSTVKKVNSANEELAETCSSDLRSTAVVDVSRFSLDKSSYDSAGTVTLGEHDLKSLTYETNSSGDGFVVFSEIYYPDWVATIDGKKVPLLRANYVLRALEVSSGKHTIKFSFEPAAYIVGNKVTTASSWIIIVVLLGSIGMTLRKEKD